MLSIIGGCKRPPSLGTLRYSAPKGTRQKWAANLGVGTGVGLDEGCELGEGVGVDVGVLEGSVVGVQDGQGVGLNTGTGFPIACKAQAA